MSLETGVFHVKLVRGCDKLAMLGSDPRMLHASLVMTNDVAEKAARGPKAGVHCTVSFPVQPLLLHFFCPDCSACPWQCQPAHHGPQSI